MLAYITGDMKRVTIRTLFGLTTLANSKLTVDAFAPSHRASATCRAIQSTDVASLPHLKALPEASLLTLDSSLITSNVVYGTLHNPTTWSILAMTSIVSLLVTWENAIENIRENTPKPIVPVIDSMLAEVGGLGFVGLFLSTVS